MATAVPRTGHLVVVDAFLLVSLLFFLTRKSVINIFLQGEFCILFRQYISFR